MTQIAIVVYPGFTALDFIGPYEVLRWLPDAEIRFVWHGKATDAETTEAHAGRDIWFLLDIIATLTAEVGRLREASDE